MVSGQRGCCVPVPLHGVLGIVCNATRGRIENAGIERASQRLFARFLSRNDCRFDLVNDTAEHEGRSVVRVLQEDHDPLIERRNLQLFDSCDFGHWIFSVLYWALTPGRAKRW
jgi:hypothetical protein